MLATKVNNYKQVQVQLNVWSVYAVSIFTLLLCVVFDFQPANNPW